MNLSRLITSGSIFLLGCWLLDTVPLLAASTDRIAVSTDRIAVSTDRNVKSGVINYCKDPSSWPVDQKDALKERCDSMEQMDALRKEAINKSEAWISEHGRSEKMTEVFRSYGDRIPVESVDGDTVTWKYSVAGNDQGAKRCIEFEFDLKGNLKGNRDGKCLNAGQ